jgi:hypothetical protein
MLCQIIFAAKQPNRNTATAKAIKKASNMIGL